MCPLNFSEGHHYANGGLTNAVPLLLTQTFVGELQIAIRNATGITDATAIETSSMP
jgi:hypothetical protein